ncbi:hypothetical protein CATYP_10065 [Corynebacterium atypicum]|uniref:EfeO-type cupredoxin-like domain-containing protein n=1 Tax=Corynebacterium atypicum TaxID=191610 RepID=A0ABM5QPX7_9CORY|nr:cupredoxin domain-containing protein [Corynebacterium atypicum]AIG64835.1 hypothetical protein CATYP_10065 [Corynebacterium atypicum]
MSTRSGATRFPAPQAAPTDTTTPSNRGPGAARRSPWAQIDWPVTVWIAVIFCAGMAHPFLPNYRLVVIHIFTPGILANSILLWSHVLTTRFCHPSARWRARAGASLGPRQLVFNAGVVAVLVGDMLEPTWAKNWALTQAGAALVAVAAAWHAAVLAAGLRAAGPGARRTTPSVWALIGSFAMLVLGAALGGIAAMRPAGLDAVRAAHVTINVFGFVGLAAAGSLIILFPAVWRYNKTLPHPGVALIAMAVGALLAAGGFIAQAALGAGGPGAARTDAQPVPVVVAAAGLGIIAVAWFAALISWLGDARRAELSKANYASLSVAAAPAWLVVATAVFAVRVAREGAGAELPTTPLLVGFAAQLLFGMLSYLVPTVLHKRAVFGHEVAFRGGVFRFVLFNLSLFVWLAAQVSYLKILASFACIGVLFAVPVLLLRAARVQLATPAQPAARPRLSGARGSAGSAALAVALVAFTVACFGGLGDAAGSAPGTTSTAAGAGGSTAGSDAGVQRLHIRAGEYVFLPETVDVPAGSHVILELSNEDSMMHDLALDNGARSGRLKPGESTELDLGVIDRDVEGWCSIAGHRTRGMVLHIRIAH